MKEVELKKIISEIKAIMIKSKSPKIDGSHQIDVNNLDRLIMKMLFEFQKKPQWIKLSERVPTIEDGEMILFCGLNIDGTIDYECLNINKYDYWEQREGTKVKWQAIELPEGE